MTYHDRTVTSGAWLGGIAVATLLWWADARMPYFPGWLLNTAVILGAAYGMARWKRAWYGWLLFWLLAVLCVTEAILKVTTSLLDSQWSGTTWLCAWVFTGAWYWLIRAPRRQMPATDEVHVIHHHVFHAPGDAREIPASPRQVAAEVPGRPPRAIEQAAVQASAFIGRRGELSARLREIRRRKP